MAEDISEFTNETKSDYTFYNKDGNLEKNETPKTCAFSLEKEQKDSYFIKFFRGTIFDPDGIDSNKINAINVEFRKVEKKTFDFYVEYLKTKKRNSLTWAERSNIDV